eukprot:3141111-Rhodomonas_salina.1
MACATRERRRVQRVDVPVPGAGGGPAPRAHTPRRSPRRARPALPQAPRSQTLRPAFARYG